MYMQSASALAKPERLPLALGCSLVKPVPYFSALDYVYLKKKETQQAVQSIVSVKCNAMCYSK